MSNFLKTLLMPLVALINKKADRSEIPVIPKIPTMLSELRSDSAHRTVTDEDIANWDGKSDFSGDYNDLNNQPNIPSVPTDILRYSVQALTDAEKTQARENIGAMDSAFKQMQANLLEVDRTSPSYVQGGLFVRDINTNVVFTPNKTDDSFEYDGLTYNCVGTITDFDIGIPYGVIIGINSASAQIASLYRECYIAKTEVISGYFACYFSNVMTGQGSVNGTPYDVELRWCISNKQLNGEYMVFLAYTNKSYNYIYDIVGLTVYQKNPYIDQKYLPASVQFVGKDLIVPSSTEGSTKQFKITVDDSGTLIAAEITE